MREFTVLRLGIVGHEAVATEMVRLQQARLAEEIPDTLILVEHPEIVTVGPKGRRDGVVVPESYVTAPIDRGGGLTWHGPGQLVGYPIFRWNLDGEANVASVTSLLESWIIAALSLLGVDSGRDPRMQGVWVAEHKVASIGLAFLKWVSRHGFTINYDTPAGRVESLAACGMEEGTTTSLAALGRDGLTRVALEEALLSTAAEVLHRSVGEVHECVGEVRECTTGAPWLLARAKV